MSAHQLPSFFYQQPWLPCGAAVQQSPWPAPAGRGFLALLCSSAAGDPAPAPRPSVRQQRGVQLTRVLSQRAETLPRANTDSQTVLQKASVYLQLHIGIAY